MRSLKKIKKQGTFEFELDLAPLLAVMVKLVPVLLISSAFVQMSIIETELPQPIREALQDPNNPTHIKLFASNKNGLRLQIETGSQKEILEAQNKDQKFDFEKLQQNLVLAKKNHPEVWRLELSPESDVSYQNIIKIMDEARKSKDLNTTFPMLDKKTNKETQTNYMFPDVVFSNINEG